MRSIFVFDACTVINILRIDTENVLYEYLKSLDIHISSLVYKEIKKNIFKKNIDKESSERISTILPLIPSNFKVHNDDDTINVIGRNFFNKIKEYVKHQKKENGELMSSILSLQLSRAEDSSIFFVTDDYPAKKQFLNFFSLEQIGQLLDSVDLLLILHWNKSPFIVNELKKKLEDLRAEYNASLRDFISQLEEVKKSSKTKPSDKKIIVNLIDSFWADGNQLSTHIKSLEGSRDKKIKKCLLEYPNLLNTPEQVKKINHTLKELNTMTIYKIH